MANKYSCGIEDLLELFDNSLKSSDILHSKLMAQISTAITKERIKLHMTQSEFADHIDVNQSLISRWEKGTYNFSLKKLSEIASKLNLDVNIMFFNISEHKTLDFFSEPFVSGKIIRYSNKEKNNPELRKYEPSISLTPTKTLKKEESNNYVTIR